MSFAIQGRGTPGQKVGRFRSPFRGAKLSFFAEEGVIVVVDEETGQERTVSMADWRDRIIAFARGVTSPGCTASDRRDLRSLLDQMVLAGREAMLQGDPYDAAVLAEKFEVRPATRVSMSRSGLILPGAEAARAADEVHRPRVAGGSLEQLLGARVDGGGTLHRLIRD